MRKLLLTACVSSLAAVALSLPADAARRSSKAQRTQATTYQYQTREYRIVVHNNNSAYYRGNGTISLRDNSRPFFASPPDGPAFFASMRSPSE